MLRNLMLKDQKSVVHKCEFQPEENEISWQFGPNDAQLGCFLSIFSSPPLSLFISNYLQPLYAINI